MIGDDAALNGNDDYTGVAILGTECQRCCLLGKGQQCDAAYLLAPDATGTLDIDAFGRILRENRAFFGFMPSSSNLCYDLGRSLPERNLQSAIDLEAKAPKSGRACSATCDERWRISNSMCYCLY